jgi:hypothetical protein
MLDELALRRETFEEGVPIVLGDGQSWHFPKPWVCLYPQVVNGKVERVSGSTTFGPEFDALTEAVNGEEGTTQAIFGVAVFLLNRNYSLPDSAYSELLRWTVNGGPTEDMLGEIMRVARGFDAPKPSPAGGDSPA